MKKQILLLVFLALGISTAFAQKTFSGTVIGPDGLGLPGVSVVEKANPVNGVSTDIDGNWTLTVPNGKSVLQFTSIGMKAIELPAKDAGKITMKSDAQMLDDVVVTGYGSTAKKDLTGSITSIDSDKIENEPVASVAQALQGKSSGLQVVSTGGRAGNNAQISLRGNGSLKASNDVLYVIDGVPQENMSSVSPSDIKSISVLKDAASTAIYGSRASNGVILIETNKGYYEQPTTVSINTSFGFQNPLKRMKMLNAAGYKKVLDAARINYQQDIASGVLAGPKDPTVLTPVPASKYDTDWFDLVMDKNAMIQNHQVSVSGGGESTKAYLSGTFFSQDGIIKQNTYKSGKIRANVEQKVNKFVSVGLRGYFTYSRSTPVADDNNTYQPYSLAMKARPDATALDENGKIKDGTGFRNPLYAFERELTDTWQNTGGTFYFDVKPIEGLVWHSAYSGNIRSNRYNLFDAPNTKRGADGEKNGFGYYRTKNNRDYLIENTVNYDRKFFNEKLKFNVLLGHSFQKWSYEDSFIQGQNFPSNDLKWLVSAGKKTDGRSYIKEMSLESYFSRLKFNWDDKYNLMLSFRTDASSKFTEENRWGSFPALSFGWTLSNEDFFKVDWVNMLKLRASFGYTGNQTGISYASGQNLLNSGKNYDGEPGLAAVDIFNPDLKWEKGEALNLGVDFSFSDRYNLTVDYYNKKTKNLLYRINVAQETGFNTKLANVGEISNKGFEVDFKANILKDTEVKWDFGVNFSYNDNKVEDIGTDEGFYNTGFVSRVEEGKSLGTFTLYEAKGIAQETYTYKDKNGKAGKVVAAGDMIYVDQNQDGKIDDKDKKTFEGGIAPIYGGFNTRVEYKGFDLSISGQYSLGKKVYAFYKTNVLNGGNLGAPSYSPNMITDMLDYWTPENTGAENPRPHLSSDVSKWNLMHSSRFLEDADYLKIQDITLGYNMKNLVDLKFISGIDPEVYYVDVTAENSQDRTDGSKISAGVDMGGIPNTRSFIIGLNVKF